MSDLKRVALTLITTVAALAACVPPPKPPPAPLPGDPHFVGQQQLTFTVVDNHGDIVIECHLVHEAVFDLGYETVQVTARAFTSGCPFTDWVDTTVTASCSIGGVLNCGGPWTLPAAPAYNPVRFRFATIPPHLGIITTTLRPTFRLGTPTEIDGHTPPIRCSTALQQCKFQV
jgi:hypothetical protein